MMELTKLTIDRQKWGRGKLGGYLLGTDGLKCCLGFLGEACDIPKEKLYNTGTPFHCQVEGSHWPTGVIKFDSKSRPYTNSDWTRKAIDINDEPHTPDEIRESRLIDHFKEINIELDFIG